METQDGGRTWKEVFLLSNATGGFQDIDVVTTATQVSVWAVGEKGLTVRFVSESALLPVPTPTPTPAPVSLGTWHRQNEFTSILFSNSHTPAIPDTTMALKTLYAPPTLSHDRLDRA